jgi:hypothetical protein
MKTFKTMTDWVFALLIGAVMATSAHADVTFKFKDGSKAGMWREGCRLAYKLCAKDTTL